LAQRAFRVQRIVGPFRAAPDRPLLPAAPFLCYTARDGGAGDIRFGHRVVRSANYRPGFRVTSGAAEDRDCSAFIAIPFSEIPPS